MRMKHLRKREIRLYHKAVTKDAEGATNTAYTDEKTVDAELWIQRTVADVALYGQTLTRILNCKIASGYMIENEGKHLAYKLLDYDNYMIREGDAVGVNAAGAEYVIKSIIPDRILKLTLERI